MNGFVTAKEAATKWNVSQRTVQALCADGKILGAIKMGNLWVIPENAEYPNDGRLKNGKYINWRKTKREGGL